MIFDGNNVRTKWDDSLDGKEGYFSDDLYDNDYCLKSCVTNDKKCWFGKVEAPHKFDLPFRFDGTGWAYFYPVPEIPANIPDTAENIISTQEIIDSWNAKADKYNQWSELSDNEKALYSWGYEAGVRKTVSDLQTK